MKDISLNLRFAYARIALYRYEDGHWFLCQALRLARALPDTVPKHRCLRAYIAQAIQALEQANANS